MSTTSQKSQRPPRQPDEVVYEGFLMKRGEHIRNWRQRYFVLFKDGALLGFKQKVVPAEAGGAGYTEPLNDFTVKDVQIMKCDRPKPNTILVRGLQWTTVIERMFYAETPELRDAWINAIKSVAENLKKEEALNGGCQDQDMLDVSHLPQAADPNSGLGRDASMGTPMMPFSSPGGSTYTSGFSSVPSGASSGAMPPMVSAMMQQQLKMTVEVAGAQQQQQMEHDAAVAKAVAAHGGMQSGDLGIAAAMAASAAVPAPPGNRYFVISLTVTTTNHLNNYRYQSRIGLEDFDFLKVLGKGTFGKVILCREKRTDRLYAIKILKKEVIIAKDEVAHTLTENRVLQRCRHPFLTELIYSFQTSDRLCFVMEFAIGGDLYYHLNREVSMYKEGFSESRTRFYGAEIVLALGYLHDNNIVYRDLKVSWALLTLFNFNYM